MEQTMLIGLSTRLTTGSPNAIFLNGWCHSLSFHKNCIELCPKKLSKPIMSEEGKKLGLIDSLVASEELLKVSWQWALDMANMHKPLVRSLHRTDKIGSLSEAHNLINIARQQARKTAPNMPQHQVCLDTIEVGIVQRGYSGVLQVKKVFNDVVSSDTSRGLVHAFFFPTCNIQGA